MNYANTWLHWAMLAATFAALTAVFSKLGLREVDSDLATLVRTAVILVVLAAFVVSTGKWQNPLTLPAKAGLFLVLSALATGASWVCYLRALQVGDASRVAAVDKLSVVLVAFFAFALLGERPASRDWLGVLLVTGGLVLLAFKR